MKEDKGIPQLKKIRSKLTPEALVPEVCKEFAIDKEVAKEGNEKK